MSEITLCNDNIYYLASLQDQKYEIASSRYQKVSCLKLLFNTFPDWCQTSEFRLVQVIDFLEHEISLKGEAEDERKALLQAGRLNLAMCHLKMSQWIEARGVCDKVENSLTLNWSIFEALCG